GSHRLHGLCPHCGTSGVMWRGRLTSAGNRVVRCSHCKQDHTRSSTRPDRLEATCPACGQTTRQCRAGITTAGNRAVPCAHCGKNYILKGNPDYVRPPAWISPGLATPEESLQSARNRLAAGPTEEELSNYAARITAELDLRYPQRLAEIEAMH